MHRAGRVSKVPDEQVRFAPTGPMSPRTSQGPKTPHCVVLFHAARATISKSFPRTARVDAECLSGRRAL